jgi:hypothetical protein
MAEAPELRWFAVDCEPLDRRRLWVVTGAIGDIAADHPALHVVLPAPAARRIAEAGEGSEVASVGVEHYLVSLELDVTRAAGEARLEQILLLAYETCFA